MVDRTATQSQRLGPPIQLPTGSVAEIPRSRRSNACDPRYISSLSLLLTATKHRVPMREHLPNHAGCIGRNFTTFPRASLNSIQPDTPSGNAYHESGTPWSVMPVSTGTHIPGLMCVLNSDRRLPSMASTVPREVGDGDNLEKIAARIEKILALGRRGGTEAEASTAMAKAQELLALYNLDISSVGRGAATREKTTTETGMYLYQRNLWNSVADLNFCLCMRTQEWATYRGRSLLRNKMLVVGKKVNVRATIAMGTYLEQVVNRLCHDRLDQRVGDRQTSVHQIFFSSWAVSFREGVVARVVEKIRERRQATIVEDNKKKAEADRRGGASTATDMTLVRYADEETDANIDFLYGGGTAANWAAKRVEQAAAAVAADREYAEWAAANPEEAKKEERKRRARSNRAGYGRFVMPTKDSGGYWAGYDAGDGIGIDPQAGSSVVERISHG